MCREFSFRVSHSVLQLGIRGAFLRMTGLSNRATDPEFDNVLRSSLDSILPSLSREVIEGDVKLKGFRALHNAVKGSSKKNVASPESLLNVLLERKSIPRINLLVDIYNLVSVESRLAIGAHDIAKITGDVELRLTDGSERFVPLGASEPKSISSGEYAYIDSSNEVICRLEVRQVEKTKVDLQSSDCFYIVQGSCVTDYAHVDRAVKRLASLTQKFCGGQMRVLYSTGWQAEKNG